MSRARRALLLAAGLALAACGGDPPPADEVPSPEQLRAAAQRDTLDPWPHYGLARWAEAEGRWDEAVREYGQTINLLPPRRVTRPMLDLGVLHHRMGHLAPARRCYLEVLDTQPGSGAGYRKNQDYRAAARSLRALALAQGEPVDEALAWRFVDELGGDPREWETPPPWLRPLERPRGAVASAAPVGTASAAPLTSAAAR
ncbi:MAG: type IV pilus biogenesis/stability protein PilW [Planctomycetota bacterium]